LPKLFSGGKNFAKPRLMFVCGAGRKRGPGKMNSRSALASAGGGKTQRETKNLFKSKVVTD